MIYKEKTIDFLVNTNYQQIKSRKPTTNNQQPMNYKPILLSAMMTLSSMTIQAITPDSLLQQKIQAEENTFLANMKPGLQHTIVIPIMRSYIKPINRLSDTNFFIVVI